MRRIARVIIQGEISNPDDYTITSGNRWLGEFDNLKIVHPELGTARPSFVIEWKNGSVGRWNHDFEISTDWHLRDVQLTYIDGRGSVIVQANPVDFRFHFNISKSGCVKNWKVRKSEFISILKWLEDCGEKR